MSLSTDSFELYLLAAVVQDDSILKRVSGIADLNVFQSSMAVEVYDVVKSYYSKYNSLPDRNTIVHLYSQSRSISDDGNLTKFLDFLYETKINQTFVIDEIGKYVRLRKLEKLFRENFENSKLGKDVDISSAVAELFKIQSETLQNKHIYGVGIEESDFILEKGEKRLSIPTNVTHLNEVLSGGGLSSGQLGIILAPPNHGKTMMLLNFAVKAFIMKHNVLFVTLEMPEFSILKRVIMIMSGALGIQVSMNTVVAITKELQRRFMVLYKPVRSINVDYLYSVYHQAEADGVKFDAVFIDYADLLSSSKSHKERRFELADIFASLKSFSQTVDIPVWTATQANRAGLRAETVTMEHMSESIEKANISDVVLSLGSKMEADFSYKMFLTKNREGRSDVLIDAFVNRNFWIESSSGNTGIGLDNVQ